MSGWLCRIAAFVLCLGIPAVSVAQAPVRLRARTFVPAANVHSMAPAPRAHVAMARGLSTHLLVQFSAAITRADLARLRAAGAVPLRYVPDNALAIAVDGGFDPATVGGIRWAGTLAAQDKVSAETSRDLTRSTPQYPRTVVEFHPDVDRATAAARLAAAGATGEDAPYLPGYMAVIATSRATLERLAADDHVAWIYPAAQELPGGGVLACEGTLTTAGVVANFATIGEGWDGPGRNAAALSYFFQAPSADLDAAVQRNEVVRALLEWARYIDLTWQPAVSAQADRSVTVLWGDTDHGDGYPFSPEVLAHTFYPAPTAPEPAAGDMHFNENYLWGAGDPSRYDIFSVALHEAGHALGLAHASNPDSVMYPMYQGIVGGLEEYDIAAARSLYEAVSAQHAGAWVDSPIGTGMAGGATERNGIVTIDATGRDIWDQADEFRFVHSPLAGDGDIVARLDSLTAVHRWSKAGVMIRATAAPDAPHAFMLVSGGKGLAFQRRRTAGGTSFSTEPIPGTAPHWLWLSRRGTRLEAYAARDGEPWQLVGADTIALGAVALAGLAVTSHDPAAVATAVFSNVTVRPAPPWTLSDVGAVGVGGTWKAGATGGRVAGAGDDIWDQADAFTFVWLPLRGDGEIVARVASVQYTRAWTKAGVMIRGNLTPGAPHAFMLVSAGKGYAFQRRVDQGAWSTHSAGGAGTAPQWVRLVRRGTLITASRSADGATWIDVGSDTFAMGSDVLVGLAVSSHAASALAEAAFDSVSVKRY